MKVPEPRKLSSGKWFIQLRLGGESVSISDYSKKECLRQAQLIKAEYLAGKRQKQMNPAPESPTLSEAVDRYIAQRSNTLSPATIRGYRTIQRNRFQEQMSRRLDQIAPEDWQGIVNQEAARCGPKTLKNAWGFIRSVAEEATGSYPPEVKLPALAPPEKPFLAPEQIRLFVSAIAQTKYAVPALLALSSLRASEIQALDWSNIPPNPAFIRVSGAAVPDERHKMTRKAQNKNASSARNVPVMIPELAAALERDRQPSGPVLRYGQGSLRRAIQKVCQANSLPNIGIHGLRHSFASLAYHLQMPEKIAMEIGGWADASTMHKIYTHIAKADIARYQTAMMKFYAASSAPLPPEKIR
jgi:integrase